MDAPIVKATSQAAALSGLSNIIGQLIACWQSNKPYTINPTDLVHFVLFALFNCPPNYLWQSWLEGQFPGYTDKLSPAEKERLVDDATTSKSSGASSGNGALQPRAGGSEKDKAMTSESTPSITEPKQAAKKLNIRNTAIKFTLDQTLGAAMNTVLFIAGIALLRGHSLESIQQDIQAQFWPMIFAGQKLWPLVSVLNFTVVPFEHRTLVGSVVGLFWGIYLSLVSGARK